MSKLLECPYCLDTYFWVEICKCPTYVYYDYMEDELFISRASENQWETHLGDYNLVYLGEL